MADLIEKRTKIGSRGRLKPGTEGQEETPDSNGQVILASEELATTPPLSVLGKVRCDQSPRIDFSKVEQDPNRADNLPRGAGNMLSGFPAKGGSRKKKVKPLEVKPTATELKDANLPSRETFIDPDGGKAKRPQALGPAPVPLPVSGSGPSPKVGAHITIRDVPASMVIHDADWIQNIHLFFERLAVPLADRSANKPVSGYMFVDTKEELRSILSAEKAQVLVATDEKNNLLGVLIYHLQSRKPPKEDRVLMKVVRKIKGDKDLKLRLERTGIAHVIGVDTRVRELALDPIVVEKMRSIPKMDGKASPSRGRRPQERSASEDPISARGLLAMLMHSCMILECRRKAIEALVGYVRTDPNRNLAVKSHKRLGCRLTGYAFEIKYEHPATHLTENVTNELFVLDVTDTLQTALIGILHYMCTNRAGHKAAGLFSVAARDLDPT
jgi:hypothetical protein